jgi:hypothetical protein
LLRGAVVMSDCYLRKHAVCIFSLMRFCVPIRVAVTKSVEKSSVRSQICQIFSMLAFLRGVYISAFVFQSCWHGDD